MANVRVIEVKKGDVALGRDARSHSGDYSTDKPIRSKAERFKRGDNNIAFMYEKGWISNIEREAANEIRWLLIRKDKLEGRRDTLTRLGEITCEFKGFVSGLERKF